MVGKYGRPPGDPPFRRSKTESLCLAVRTGPLDRAGDGPWRFGVGHAVAVSVRRPARSGQRPAANPGPLGQRLADGAGEGGTDVGGTDAGGAEDGASFST